MKIKEIICVILFSASIYFGHHMTESYAEKPLKDYMGSMKSSKCLLLKIGQWKYWGKDEQKFDERWDRDMQWYNPKYSLFNETGQSLIKPTNRGSEIILKSNGKKIYDEHKQFQQPYLVYVGPWEKMNFVYPASNGEKSRVEEKKIRLYAYQTLSLNFYGPNKDRAEEGSNIDYSYEEASKENEKIPEMPLKLIKETSDHAELCYLKWHIEHGYNAIAENYQKLRPGFWNWLFRDYELVITGKIIESKE